ncbi:MAG: membrane dipeptidase [Verrucomicrobiales bacterium]|jgi:membrane dipeptidase
MMIFDAHLDLSLNALEYNRDLQRPLAEIREREQGMVDLKGRGCGTVCFEEMRRAGIGLCVATQIGGCMHPPGPVASWASPAQAWAMTQGQLAWYRAMEDAGEMRSIRSAADLDEQLAAWATDPSATPIGYVLSLEGSDSIRTLADLETAYEYGLRALGPAHYGTGRYALGHDRRGPLSRDGKEFVREMDRLGLILDLTHLCDETFWNALDCYSGSVWASHHNCRALVDDPRQLSDEQIRAIAERGGVIGLAFDAWMIVPGWVRGETTPQSIGVTLEDAVNHIDHICQLLGNVEHVGLGTDLDGGFGNEQCPLDLDSIGELPKILDCLRGRGYSQADVSAVAHGNFVQLLRTGLG